MMAATASKLELLNLFALVVLVLGGITLVLFIPIGSGYGLVNAGGLLLLLMLLNRFVPGYAISGMDRDRNVEARVNTELEGLREITGMPVELRIPLEKSDSDEEPNAMVCGLGDGRRLVVNYTLATEFKSEHVVAIVAHELAHLKKRHISWVLFIVAIGVGLVHLLSTLVPSSGLGTFLFFASTFGLILLKFHIDRRFEYAADHQAGVWVGSGLMAEALTQLGLTETPKKSNPGWLRAPFRTHPPIERRVARLLAP